jgi:hypothetical protein
MATASSCAVFGTGTDTFPPTIVTTTLVTTAGPMVTVTGGEVTLPSVTVMSVEQGVVPVSLLWKRPVVALMAPQAALLLDHVSVKDEGVLPSEFNPVAVNGWDWPCARLTGPGGETVSDARHTGPTMSVALAETVVPAAFTVVAEIPACPCALV